MADPLDILTPAEALAAVNGPAAGFGANQALKLAMFVTGISRRVDAMCGAVVQREVVEVHSGGCRRIQLVEAPAVALVEVTVDGNEFAGAVLDNTSRFRTYLDHPTGSWPTGTANVAVTYTAGRHVDTANVDPLFKLQVSDILNYQWKQAAGVWAQAAASFDEVGAAPAGQFLAVDDMIRRRLAGEIAPMVA